jgi:hypothetical protein
MMSKTGGRRQTMGKIAVGLLTLALFGWLSVTPVPAAPAPVGDYALFNSATDTSVQAGATGDVNATKPTSFTVNITMTNSGDAGHVRVTYQGLEPKSVDYAIPADTTLQISLAGGGIPGEDQIITVTKVGAAAVLTGQISLTTSKGKPHPDLPGQTTKPTLYCSTTVTGP